MPGCFWTVFHYLAALKAQHAAQRNNRLPSAQRATWCFQKKLYIGMPRPCCTYLICQHNIITWVNADQKLADSVL